MLAFRTKAGISPRDLQKLDAIDRQLMEGVEAQLPLDFLVRSVGCSSEEALGRLARLIAVGLLEEERLTVEAAPGKAARAQGKRERGRKARHVARTPVPANDVARPQAPATKTTRRALSVTEVDGRNEPDEPGSHGGTSAKPERSAGTRGECATQHTSDAPLNLPGAEVPVKRVSRVTEVDARSATDSRTSLPPPTSRAARPPAKQGRRPSLRTRTTGRRQGARGADPTFARATGASDVPPLPAPPKAPFVHGQVSSDVPAQRPQAVAVQPRQEGLLDAGAADSRSKREGRKSDVQPTLPPHKASAQTTTRNEGPSVPRPPQHQAVQRGPERRDRESVHDRVTVIDESRTATAREMSSPRSIQPDPVMPVAKPAAEPKPAGPGPAARPNPFGEEAVGTGTLARPGTGTLTAPATGTTQTTRGTGTMQAPPPARPDKPNGTLIGVGTLVYDRNAKNATPTAAATRGGTGTMLGIGSTSNAASNAEGQALAEIAREWERGSETQRAAALQIREAIRKEAEGQYGPAMSMLQLVLLRIKDQRVVEQRERLKKKAERTTANTAELRDRARAASKAKDHECAAELWSKVAFLLPKDLEAQACAAAALIHARGPKEALPYAERAVELDPRSVGAHKLLMQVYTRSGDAQNAARVRAIVAELSLKSGSSDGFEYD